MSKVTTILILCLNAQMFGKKINLPDMGEVEISENGELEVTEAVADLLINDERDCPWAHYSEEVEDEEEEVQKKETPKKAAAKKPAEKAKSTKTKEKSKPANTEADSEEISQIKENLKKLSVEDLVEMAETAKYPEAEYEKYKTNKNLMVAYIVKKATEEN